MFDFVKRDDRISAAMYVLSMIVSLTAHAVIVAMLILLPLTFFRVMDTGTVLTFILDDPELPKPPAPPSPPAMAAAAEKRVVARPGLDFRPPLEIPEGVLPEPPDEPIRMLGADTRMAGDYVQGIGRPSVAEAGGTLEAIARRGIAGQPRVPPTPPERPREVIRVGSIEPSRVLRRVDPAYPAIALKVRASGKVILEAVIDEEGNITGLRVVSGHPLLNDAAVEAVRQWKYTPTIQNGEPVAVVATIEVIFRIL